MGISLLIPPLLFIFLAYMLVISYIAKFLVKIIWDVEYNGSYFIQSLTSVFLSVLGILSFFLYVIFVFMFDDGSFIGASFDKTYIILPQLIIFFSIDYVIRSIARKNSIKFSISNLLLFLPLPVWIAFASSHFPFG
jgi:hypothetical protein